MGNVAKNVRTDETIQTFADALAQFAVVVRASGPEVGDPMSEVRSQQRDLRGRQSDFGGALGDRALPNQRAG